MARQSKPEPLPWHTLSSFVAEVEREDGQSLTLFVMPILGSMGWSVVALETRTEDMVSPQAILDAHKHKIVGRRGRAASAFVLAERFAEKWLAKAVSTGSDCTCEDIVMDVDPEPLPYLVEDGKGHIRVEQEPIHISPPKEEIDADFEVTHPVPSVVWPEAPGKIDADFKVPSTGWSVPPPPVDPELERLREQNPCATIYRDDHDQIHIIGAKGVHGGGKGGDVHIEGALPPGSIIRGGNGGVHIETDLPPGTVVHGENVSIKKGVR